MLVLHILGAPPSDTDLQQRRVSAAAWAGALQAGLHAALRKVADAGVRVCDCVKGEDSHPSAHLLHPHSQHVRMTEVCMAGTG